MQVIKADFKCSSEKISQVPKDDLRDIAFIGRSNVGKSSLINMLTERNALAKTSATPGKTLLINHFLINKEWYIVDLPGYGYAKRSKDSRDKFRKIIEGYILHREQMTNLFVLVDSRHDPQKIDLEFMDWLGENGVPFSIVFTKMDKLGKVVGVSNVKKYLKKLKESWEELPPYFMTSSEDGRGREELLGYIEEINKSLQAE